MATLLTSGRESELSQPALAGAAELNARPRPSRPRPPVANIELVRHIKQSKGWRDVQVMPLVKFKVVLAESGCLPKASRSASRLLGALSAAIITAIINIDTQGQHRPGRS